MPASTEDTWTTESGDAASEGSSHSDEAVDQDATLASNSVGTNTQRAPRLRDALAPGTVVGRFLILAKLGAGGMGVVHAAYDPELDRKVALKLLLPSRDGASGDARARLQREAQALAKLAHPNVVGIHDVGAFGDRVWIAMEYIDGQTLSAWTKSRARSWREVLDVMTKVGRGVAAAHAAGLLHRDLKPDNVMIGTDARVRVMDFGLARNHADRSVSEPGTSDEVGALALELTRSGTLLGTPAYMAPEQFEGKAASTQSDQFSFCVTFWEALYGQRPFAGKSIPELMASVLAGKIAMPPRGIPVPPWLRRALETGLARDPSQRFASIEQLLVVLSQSEGRVRIRRVGVALAAVALGVLGVYAAQLRDEQGRADDCAAAGARIAELWNADARAALRAGLVATKVHYAPTVADKVMPWIDAQAHAWQDATTHACMRARVEKTWDVATLDKASFCLEDRRIELATLIHELADADATVVLEAVQAASSLAPIATCIDETSLAGMPEPPDAAMRDRVAQIREQLSRASYLASSGKIAKGLELSRTARSEAESLDWPPLTAAALALEASLLGASGAYVEAETAGLAAYLAAWRSRSWDVAASAGHKLVAAIARQGRNDEARVWLELATVAQEFAGDPLELREADRLLALGNLDNQAKHYDRAAESFEAARAIWARVLGPDHPLVALAYNNRANAHWGKHEYDEALALHQRALEIRERALGPTHPDVAQTIFNLGVIHDEKGEREQARALYERALALEEAALGPAHPDLAASLINLGNALQRQGEFAASKPFYERALKIQEAALGSDNLELALVLDNLGIAHEELGEFEDARREYMRALGIRERTLPADDPEMAASQRNLAELELMSGNYEQARVSFEQTLAILQANHGPDALELAKPTQRLGETLSKLGRQQEALAQLERALAMRTSGGVGPELIAESQFALALGLWDAPASAGGDRTRARTLAEQARDGYREVEGWELELGEVELWLTKHSPPANGRATLE